MGRGQTFMYFQTESDLRETLWKFGHFNNKTRFRVRNLYKKLLVMTTCYKQVNIIKRREEKRREEKRREEKRREEKRREEKRREEKRREGKVR